MIFNIQLALWGLFCSFNLQIGGKKFGIKYLTQSHTAEHQSKGKTQAHVHLIIIFHCFFLHNPLQAKGKWSKYIVINIEKLFRNRQREDKDKMWQEENGLGKNKKRSHREEERRVQAEKKLML